MGKILIRSLLDRTLFVLGRAVMVAAPAGLVIWIMANITVDSVSLLDHSAGFLDPFARLIGLDGYILMAFILGLPANEIVIPIIIMSYMSTGSLAELNMHDLRRLCQQRMDWLTAVCTMLFSLNHFPCATTLLTIRKETRSWKLTDFIPVPCYRYHNLLYRCTGCPILIGMKARVTLFVVYCLFDSCCRFYRIRPFWDDFRARAFFRPVCTG